MTDFPSDVPGRLRVAYLIAAEIARQNGDQRPYVNDLGEGVVHISGRVDLGAVVDALVAAAPPEKALWWNDGPIRDHARDAVMAVFSRHGYSLPRIADLCAGAALSVAHRAGYAPVRPLDAVVEVSPVQPMTILDWGRGFTTLTMPDDHLIKGEPEITPP